MNFFSHQEHARRQTRRLVFLFALAVLAIVGVLNLVLLLLMGAHRRPTEYIEGFVLLTVVALLLIGGASFFRVASLRQGGSAVARAMGATLVPPDTRNPQWRRLRNVVEEIALASGVPTPQVYVMAQEEGINAFAAGYAPTDAAVAVTQGCLDALSRDELQGVIAHEFSHIRNGDMRLNIRLMGVLFGILVLGVLGRMILRGGLHGAGRSRNARDSGGQGALIAVGLALLIVGYVGVFFGRLIKAGVSRQREFLADASAVQYTRQPAGIAGALKKIGALSTGSRLQAPDTEEVSHMLFASGIASFSQWLATHPPLVQRIRAIEPGFDAREFEQVRHDMARRAEAVAEPQPAPAAATPPALFGGTLPGHLIAAAVLADLGQPDPRQIAHAAALLRTLPPPLLEATHEIDGAVAVLLMLLMGSAPDEQMQRYAAVRDELSETVAQRLRALLPAAASVEPAQRLPLLLLSLPALRERADEALAALPGVVDRLIHLDGRVTVFEYAFGHLVAESVRDVLHPRHARPAGSSRLSGLAGPAQSLLTVLAGVGHADAGAADVALRAGMARLGLPIQPVQDEPAGWVARLDAVLPALDELMLADKEALVAAMIATIEHDGVVSVEEAELLRTFCACLHVPVPLLVAGPAQA